MGIYDDVRKNIISAANKVNDYSFAKTVDKRDEFKKAFSDISAAQQEFIKNFEKLCELRNNLYSALLTTTAANYYIHRIDNIFENVDNFLEGYSLLDISDTENSFSNLLNDLRMLLVSLVVNPDDVVIKNDIQKIAEELLNIFNTVKVDFNLPDVYFDFRTSEAFTTTNAKANLDECDNGDTYKDENGKFFNVVHKLTGTETVIYPVLLDVTADDSDAISASFSISPENIGTFSMRANKNFILENGTQNFPYVISSTMEFLNKVYLNGENAGVDSDGNPYYYIFDNVDPLNPINLSVLEASKKIVGGYFYGNGVSVIGSNNNYFENATVSSLIIKNNDGETLKRYETNNDVPVLTPFLMKSGTRYSNQNLTLENDGTFSGENNIFKISIKNFKKYSSDILFEISFKIENSSATKDISLTGKVSNSRKWASSGNIKYDTIFYLGELSHLSTINTNDWFGYSPIKYIEILDKFRLYTLIELCNDKNSYISSTILDSSVYINDFLELENSRKSDDPSYNSDYTDSLITCFSSMASVISGDYTVETGETIPDTDGTNGGISKIDIPEVIKNINGTTSDGKNNGNAGLIFKGIPISVTISLPNFGSSSSSSGSDGKKSHTKITTITVVDLYNVRDILDKAYEISLYLTEKIISNIKRLASFIDQYSIFASTEKDYGTLLLGTVNVFNAYSKGTRRYSEWIFNLRNYTNDGIFNLLLLYIAQELGLNSNGSYLYNQTERSEEKIYISLFNYALMNGLKKGLWSQKVFSENFLNILKYSTKLAEDGLYIDEDVQFENINSTLILEIPDLKIMNDININPILLSLDDINEIDDYKKIEKLIEIIIIKNIFADKTNFNIIVKISNILMNCKVNFKTLLFKKIFLKTLMDLKSQSESNYFMSDITLNIVDRIINNLSNEKIDELLNKYRSAWNFIYSNNNMIYYINQDIIDGSNLYKYLTLTVDKTWETVYKGNTYVKTNNWFDNFIQAIIRLWEKIKSIF